MEDRWSIRIRTLVLGCVLAVVATGASAQSGAPVSPEVERALLEQDWRQLSQQLVGASSSSVVDRLILAHAQLASNQNNDALTHFAEAADASQLEEWIRWTNEFSLAHSSSAVAQYLKGDAHARLQQWPEAIAAFTTGLRLEPGSALLLNARGVANAAAWHMDEALVDLTLATRRRPDFADAHASLGSLWVQRQSGAPGAVRSFDRALELSPDYVIALYSRGSVKMVQGDLDQAESELERALNTAETVELGTAVRTVNLLRSVVQSQYSQFETIVADGESAGVPISRILQRLESKSGNVSETLTALGVLVERFPAYRQPVVEKLSALTRSDGNLAGQISQHVSQREKLDHLFSSLGANAAVRTISTAAPLPFDRSGSTGMGPRQGILDRAWFVAGPSAASRDSQPYLRADFSDKLRASAGTFDDLDKAAKWFSLVERSALFDPLQLQTTFPAWKAGMATYLVRATTSFGAAVLKDGADFREGRYSFARSYGLETVGKYGLEGMSFATGISSSGVTEVVRGVTSQVARGALLPNALESIDYTSGSLKATVGALTQNPAVGWIIPVKAAGLFANDRIDRAATLGRELVTSQQVARDAVQNSLNGINRSRAARGEPLFTVHQLLTPTEQFQLGLSSEPVGDFLLNRAGRESNWFGRNRSGGLYSYQRDTTGAFLLGDTKVAPTDWRDALARRHDIQYWVDQHVAKGYWVEAEGPAGRKEYFQSRGDVRQANAEVFRDNLLGTFLKSYRQDAMKTITTVPAGAPVIKLDDHRARFANGSVQTGTPLPPKHDIDLFREIKGALPTARPPGGFRTTAAEPLWQDGEWPLDPWYGLGYVVTARPTPTDSIEASR